MRYTFACLLVAAGTFTVLAQTTKEPGGDAEKQGVRVVAEGVGGTADEAVKDAFRNAVRQVVGAVVDAETLVKNDEVISDKVLTYSDGFITKYDQVSKKQDKGLFRVKIAATVERRSVVAKLKEAKITLKKVDGQGLFAETITDLEAGKNALALLEKQLEGFPLNCLETSAVGKPEVVKKEGGEATVRFRIGFQADIKKYDTFVAKLQSTLGKVARAQGEFSLRATPGRKGRGHGHDGFFFRHDYPGLMPRYFKADYGYVGPKDCFVLAVNTQRTKDLSRSDWRYFVLDQSARGPLAAIDACLMSTKVSLLDGDGKAIAVDRFAAIADHSENDGSERFRATLVHSATISKERTRSLGEVFYENMGREKTGFHEKFLSELDHPEHGEHLFFISPFFFNDRSDPSEHSFLGLGVRTMDVTLSLGELKRIQSVKCELLFDDGALPPRPDDAKEKR